MKNSYKKGWSEIYAGVAYDLLIVDDQAGVRRLLYEAFSDEGYRVETASSGLEALAKVLEKRPLLVLLDIKMPGMNGLETLDELLKIIPQTPVVMMTAYGELDIVAEAKRRGVKHYITKPFDLDEIRYLIKGLLLEEKDRRAAIKEIG